MPSFRGIELSVLASSHVEKLTEYPHPDGSSVRLMRAGAGLGDLSNKGQNSPRDSVSSFSDADPTRQRKFNPRISVYIPSIPGTQFRLRYLVNQPSPPSRFVFFKMFINGHHTVSWGMDTKASTVGSVTRCLYEPSDGFKDKDGDAPVGIEARYFHFMHAFERKPVAEDGGLIEVQVFRCQGRKRIAATLDSYPHHHQECHGIASPSGGLVETPQDATFYEYHLEDARDSPYATFRFHYRSMEYLELLNLIPQRKARVQSVSTSPNNTPVSNLQEEGSARASPSVTTGVFDHDIKNVCLAVSDPSKAPRLEEYCLKCPPPLSPARPAGIVVPYAKQAQTVETMADILQRPLPELPKTHSRQASKESVRSNCPSITPSLKRYVKSEEFEHEDIRLSMAQPILIPSESMQVLGLSDTDVNDREDNSFSDYATSLNSTEASHSPTLPSPGDYVPTNGSDLSQLDSPIAQSSPKAGAKFPLSKPEGILVDDMRPSRASTVKITEAEWLRRSPSPLRRGGRLIRRFWSPRPKHPSRSSMIEFPIRKGDIMDCEGSSRKNDSRNARVSVRNSTGQSIPAGNWI